jgi:hypothetical protein
MKNKTRYMPNTFLKYVANGFSVAVALLLMCGSIPQIKPQPSRENQVKAVFLFNFSQFVELPPGAFPEANTPFVIGILQEDPFGSYLDETIEGEFINGHPLTVKRFRNVDEIKQCHILYIRESKADGLKGIFSKLKGRNILTVGDAPKFAELGGMIRFFTESNKIKLQINLGAVKAADLTISSKLLRLAEICCAENN